MHVYVMYVDVCVNYVCIILINFVYLYDVVDSHFWTKIPHLLHHIQASPRLTFGFFSVNRHVEFECSASELPAPTCPGLSSVCTPPNVVALSPGQWYHRQR